MRVNAILEFLRHRIIHLDIPLSENHIFCLTRPGIELKPVSTDRLEAKKTTFSVELRMAGDSSRFRQGRVEGGFLDMNASVFPSSFEWQGN